MTALSKAERAEILIERGLSGMRDIALVRLCDTCDELERERDEAKQRDQEARAQNVRIARIADAAIAERDLFAARVEMLRDTILYPKEMRVVAKWAMDKGLAEDHRGHLLTSQLIGQMADKLEHALNATDDEVRAWQQRREK